MANKPIGSWWLPLILAGLSLVVSAFTGYTRNDKDLVQRVSVLEAHQEDSVSRLGRIETKVDNVDGKMDTLTSTVLQTLTKAK